MADLARIYGTSERQIYRWKDANAPLLSWERMEWFLLTRRSFPLHYLSLTTADKKAIQRRLNAITALP